MATTTGNPGPNDMTTCPYNPAHQLEHYRMHVHLVKCRKQYPNCNKVSCPFDATHIVNDVELDFHVSSCKQRAMFDAQVYITDNEHRPVVPVEPAPEIECEEDWDTEVATTYKPDPAKKGNHIIWKGRGMTPSQRRAARMEGVKNYCPVKD